MTALNTPRLGKNSKLYRNTGSYGTPTWTIFSNVKDLKLPQGFAEDDVSARITGGFEAVVATLQKVGLSFTMFDDDGTDITAARTAFYAESAVEFAIMNGPMDDDASRGVRGFFQFTKFDEGQGNDKAVSRDCELKLTWPSAAAVAAGDGSAQPISGETP